MEDEKKPHDYEPYIIRENRHGRNVDTESNGWRNHETPPDITKSTRILRVEIQSYKSYNEMLVKSQ